jgi:short subunit dehydrogenase-like uncharacterized protein
VAPRRSIIELEWLDVGRDLLESVAADRPVYRGRRRWELPHAAVVSTMWMLYGANGYTGRLIAREAVSRGMRPVLAGRDPARIEPLAAELGCASRIFSLSRPAEMAGHLAGVAAVLHCAGPFRDTAEPMMEACLARRVNYLDITGEIPVIEWASRQHARAAAAGICLLPAVGMDVVPSDCLAARLAEALPNAYSLELAFAGLLSVSHGTAKTIWTHAAGGGCVRRDGQIVRVPTAWKTMQVLFPCGSRWTVTIPWGDVSSAFHTTGIPNIAVYAALPRRQLDVLRRFRWLSRLAGLRPIQAIGRWWIDRTVTGPDADQLARGRTEFWGRATDAHGTVAEATLETPDGYALTVQTALAIVNEVLDGHIRAGFWTPARALGSGFIETMPDVTFRWRNRPGG